MTEPKKFFFEVKLTELFCSASKPAFGSTAAECEVYGEEIDKLLRNLNTIYREMMIKDEDNTEMEDQISNNYTETQKRYLAYKMLLGNSRHKAT